MKKILLSGIVVVAAVLVILFVFVFNGPKLQMFEERTLDFMGYNANLYSYYFEGDLNYDTLKMEVTKILDEKKNARKGENNIIYVFDQKISISKINNSTVPSIMAFSIPEEDIEFVGDTIDSRMIAVDSTAKAKMISDIRNIRMACQMYHFDYDSLDDITLNDLDPNYLSTGALELKGNWTLKGDGSSITIISNVKANFTNDEKQSLGITTVNGKQAAKFDL